MLGRLFVDHPRSLGLSWTEHGAGALRIGLRLIGAGLAALVHAAVPGLFTETAGRIVIDTYDHIQKIKAGSRNPDNWSDYDI